MTSRIEINQHLTFAQHLVEQAGKIALQYFRLPIDVVNKHTDGFSFDPLTVADREVETYIRAQLEAQYPDYSIMGEEQERYEGSGEYTWVVDPIDGTRAFISGVPTWGVLLGLHQFEQCLVGVMHQPYTGETYGGDGREAWLDHKGSRLKLATSAISLLSDAVLYSTHPEQFASKKECVAFNQLAETVKLQRFGGDCYSYCLLAQGCIDLVVEGYLMPYDIIPLIAIVEGAGGVITDIYGNVPLQGGTIIAAANQELHQQALDVMQTAIT